MSDSQHRNIKCTSVYTSAYWKVTDAPIVITNANTSSITDASVCVNMSKTMASSLSCNQGPTFPITASPVLKSSSCSLCPQTLDYTPPSASSIPPACKRGPFPLMDSAIFKAPADLVVKAPHTSAQVPCSKVSSAAFWHQSRGVCHWDGQHGVLLYRTLA